MVDVREMLRDAADSGGTPRADIAVLRGRANRLRRRRAAVVTAAAVMAIAGAGWTVSGVFVDDAARVDFAQRPPADAPQPREWTQIRIGGGISGPSYTRLIDLGDNTVAYVAGADFTQTRLKLAIVDLESKEVVNAPAELSWRANYAAAWSGTEVIILGGGSGSGRFRDGAAYNPATNQWRDLPPAPGNAPIGDHAAWIDGALLFWDVGLRFLPAENGWERVERAPLPPRQAPAVAANDSMVFVWGGCDASPYCDDGAGDDELSDGAFYRTDEQRWTTLPEGPLAAMDSAAAVWSGREFIVWGGNPQRGDDGSYGAAWNPETGRWREIPDGPLKERGDHAMERLDEGVLVWGGENQMSRGFHDGAIYDPVADRWSKVLRPRGVNGRRTEVVAFDGGMAIGGDDNASVWIATE